MRKTKNLNGITEHNPTIEMETLKFFRVVGCCMQKFDVKLANLFLNKKKNRFVELMFILNYPQIIVLFKLAKHGLVVAVFLFLFFAKTLL